MDQSINMSDGRIEVGTQEKGENLQDWIHH